jgi:hypothetical protein
MEIPHRSPPSGQAFTRQKSGSHGHQAGQHIHLVRWRLQAGRFWPSCGFKKGRPRPPTNLDP